MTAFPKPFTANNPSYCVIAAPFGRLGILTELMEGSLMLSKIYYLPADAVLSAPKNALAKEVARQCKAYFKDPAWQFDLPTKPTGTEHQKKYGPAFKIYRPAEQKLMVRWPRKLRVVHGQWARHVAQILTL